MGGGLEVNVSLTHWQRLTHPVGKRVRTTWPALLERLAAPRVVEVKNDAPGFALATFKGDHRKLANVESVFAIGLDLDHLDAVSVFSKVRPSDAPDWPALCRRFEHTSAFLHTTWSSTAESLRARVFLPLSRPVDAAEYRLVYAQCAGVAEASGLVVDRAASDPSRLWFLPAIPPGGTFLHFVGTGKPVNVDAAIAAAPKPAPPTERVPPSSVGPVGDVEARAGAYLDRCEPAISGSGGSTTTFVLAQKLVLGFGLSEDATYRLMQGWNSRCSPPWDERELRRKISQAAERGTMQPGSLRDAQRGR